MPQSMTAYGRGEAAAGDLKWVVELRSVNHRFLELALNLPRRLWALEDRCRRMLKARLQRGRVDMQLAREAVGEGAATLRLDQARFKEVMGLLVDLRQAGDDPQPIRLEHFFPFLDTLVTKERDLADSDPEAAWEPLSQALGQALEALEAMRRTEGAALATDMAAHIQVIRQQAGHIAAMSQTLPQLWRERVTARLAEIFPDGPPVDETRLAQEVAFLAERRDIAEELARLDSHLDQFGQTLESPEPAGRKLEFLVQEILREANTIGSKAQDLAISQAVLEIKGALERLREQVQNIE
jgi:uncharacterized protein (TIGR00255 family)